MKYAFRLGWVFCWFVCLALIPSCDTGGDSGGAGDETGVVEAGQATFVVAVAWGDLHEGSLSGSPATGAAATWYVAPGWHGGPFTANRYSISFGGDTSGLPDKVEVVITWNAGKVDDFRWAESADLIGQEAFDVPKAGGGTIGIDGTVLKTWYRPYCHWDFARLASGDTVGTVTFEAAGVQTLVLTVKRQ